MGIPSDVSPGQVSERDLILFERRTAGVREGWKKYVRKVKRPAGLLNQCRHCCKVVFDLYTVQAVDREKFGMCLVCSIQDLELRLDYDRVVKGEQAWSISQSK
jgi:hypothetical protein